MLSILNNWINAIADYMAYRKEFLKTLNELDSCTDRELADMGIHRGDIVHIAKQVKTNPNLKGWA